MNCGTCKHWGRPEDAGKTYRVCISTVHIGDEYDEGSISNDEVRRYNGDTERQQGVRLNRRYVVDGSGYYGALKCREDFGCVAWDSPDAQ